MSVTLSLRMNMDHTYVMSVLDVEETPEATKSQPKSDFTSALRPYIANTA